jgi:hypothetical protein
MAGPPSTARRSSSAGPRGFLLRTVARLLRPRIISTIRGSATLCPLPALVQPSAVFGFLAPSSDARCQDRRASLGKAYDLPTCRPATPRFDCPDIGPRLFASARPSPRGHLAGSLYATYAGSTSCFLRTRPFRTASLPCWCRPSVRSRRAVLLPVATHQKIGHSAMPGARLCFTAPEAHGRAEGPYPWSPGRSGEGPAGRRLQLGFTSRLREAPILP